LAGNKSGVSRVIRCANVHPTPTTRYVIDPREQLKELVGIYHSHPVSQPYPSPTDRAEAHYPNAVYVLVSLRTGEPEIRAFIIGADEFIRELTVSAERRGLTRRPTDAPRRGD
jgi:proteasome lid subunit RPN8/RPN11